MADAGRPGTPFQSVFDPPSPVSNAALAAARRAYRMNVRREELLGRGLFADPGWNMLLDLFISGLAGRGLSITAATIGSGASLATAHRYIGLLEAAGLIERVADPGDRRRTYLRLTVAAWTRMERLLLLDA